MTTINNPADVPAGEAWLVNVRGERRVGLRSDPYDSKPWCLPARNLHKEGTFWVSDEDVTLISRLVPEQPTTPKGTRNDQH